MEPFNDLLNAAEKPFQRNRQILEADRRVLAWHRTSEASRRLDRVPGIGPLIATALVACGFTFRNTAVVDAGNAAWLVR